MNEPTTIFAAMSRKPGPPSRWRRARWLAFLLTMLAFNAYPVSDLVTRGLAWPAVAGLFVALAVMAGLWVRTMWLALATTVPFRDIAPWLASVALLGAALALGMRGQFEGLFIYVSIASAVSLPMRWVLPALLGATLAALITDLPHPVHLGALPGSEANVIFSQLSFVFFLGLMMWFYRRTMMLINELRQAREDLAGLAVTEERLRFARDLHDLLGHSLSIISLKSQLARRLADADPAVSEQLADIETVTQQALVEIREAVTGYRQTSFAEELDRARAALAAAGIEVFAHMAGTPLPALADGLLGWVIREAATNVLRHSQAHTCRIRLTRHRDTVMLDIRDDGIGLKEGAGAGNGLTGLTERLTAAGGTIDTGPAPGKGFQITVRLPLTTGESPVPPPRHPVSPLPGGTDTP